MPTRGELTLTFVDILKRVPLKKSGSIGEDADVAAPSASWSLPWSASPRPGGKLCKGSPKYPLHRGTLG